MRGGGASRGSSRFGWQRPRPQSLRLHDVDGRRRRPRCQTVGTTDEIGLHAVEDRLYTHDLQPTILYLMGIDNMKLTYLHEGRPERPTINEGAPCKKVLA